MANKKVSRRALFTSVISLILCCAMLMGTTFAWFTDSVTSGNNIIKSGNLDVELYYKLKTTDEWIAVDSETELFDDEALWEPGYTQVVYLKICNEGSLALNYKLGLNINHEDNGVNVAGSSFKLSEYIQFGAKETTEDAMPVSREDARTAVSGEAASLYNNNNPRYKTGSLLSGSETYMTMVAFMPTTVGNEANYGAKAPSIKLGLTLVATQKMEESDSFDNTYDDFNGAGDSFYPQSGTGIAEKPAEGVVSTPVTIKNTTNNAKIASMEIPAAAFAEEAENMVITIEPTAVAPDFTVDSNDEAKNFDISVTGLKEDNDSYIKIELRVGEGLSGVEVYHDGVLIDEPAPYETVYYSETGYVVFYTKSFSPFTVVYDKVTAEPGEADDTIPVASVAQYGGQGLENMNATILEKGWGSYGDFGTENPGTQELEALFEYTAANHDKDTVENSLYKNWHADFHVKVDRDVPVNHIFLGGQYGGWPWVGFENKDFAVAANQEIALMAGALGSETSGWTYEAIVKEVKTFYCGTARVVGSDPAVLDGATITVTLRLTNPEKTTESIDIKTVTYQFGTGVTNIG